MKWKCTLGFHDWSSNCEECATCGKTRDAAHEWDGCKCSRCGDHKWEGFSCTECGHLNYLAIIDKMYRIGRGCQIARFIDRSKDEWIDKLNSCNSDADKWEFVAEQRNYLGNVIADMFNPPISNGDVRVLNEITEAMERGKSKTKTKR